MGKLTDELRDVFAEVEVVNEPEVSQRPRMKVVEGRDGKTFVVVEHTHRIVIDDARSSQKVTLNDMKAFEIMARFGWVVLRIGITIGLVVATVAGAIIAREMMIPSSPWH